MKQNKKPVGLKFINDFVDQAYVISLKNATERRNKFDAMAAEHFLEFEYFDAYGKLEVMQELAKRYPTSPSKYKFKQPSWYGKQGCKFSHLMAIDKGIKAGHSSIIVFEDDAKIYPALYRHLPYYFEELPEDWQVLFLGYFIKDKHKVKNQNVSYKVAPHLYSVTETHGAHAVIYNLESPEVLELHQAMLHDKFNLNSHFDLELNKLANEANVSRLAVHPQFITQDDGFSFINQRNKSWDLRAGDPRLNILESGTVFKKSDGEYELLKNVELEHGQKYDILKGGYEFRTIFKKGKFIDPKTKKPVEYIPIYVRKV